jgi:hypothetical protein
MRRRRYATKITPVQVKLGDVICEELVLGGGPDGLTNFVMPIGRVTGIGENQDSTWDLFLNSYVDPPDSSWHKYHKDEWLIVVRNRQERDGTRNDPKV